MDGTGEKSSKPKSRQSIAHLPPKDNTITDIAALRRKHAAASVGKRSRGKSLGPGGLEALTETDANAIQVAPIFQPKSILKPTVPLTPPKHIPSFDELRKRSTGKSKSPLKNGVEDLLIDFSTPGPSRDAVIDVPMDGAEALVDPFSPITTKSPRSSKSTKQQQNVGVDQDEDERRQREKQAILDQRAARRKSMANRRVSFAPEATLHTWSVMELAEDSTTSSASNSTRRQSSMTSAQSPAASVCSPGKSSDPVEPPSTPPEQIGEPLVKASPEHQRDLHQKKHRRSSDVSQTSEDETFSSPGDGEDSSPIRVEESIDSESDSDGDTAMSLEDATSNTVRSSGSSDTQSSLDERLRQAANHAGTKGVAYDEHGTEDEDEDESMELADGTVTHAFRQYARKNHQVPSMQSQVAADDQENIDPRFYRSAENPNDNGNEEGDDAADEGMTMEMTRVMGGILQKGNGDRRKSVSNKRRSSVGRRRSSDGDSSYGDESMDLTTVKGGILGPQSKTIDEDGQASEDGEDMTMEFTNVIGGVQPGNGRRESMQSFSADHTGSMDMTVAAGTILEPIEEQTEPQTDIEDDRTSAMEMTRAVGRIFSTITTSQSSGKSTDDSKFSKEIPPRSGSISLPDSTGASQLATVASETGSPSLKPRLSGRRTATNSRSTTPKGAPPSISTSSKGDATAQTTPSKQTPILARAKTPERTPVATNVVHRGASPKKLFSAEIKARASPASSGKNTLKSQDLLFSQDNATGHHTPRVVLHAPKPHQHLRRRSSGIGIDNEGYGSPKVSEILSRRGSIGDGVSEFKLDSGKKSGVRFEDPRQMAQEVEAEREQEQRRESGRFVMEQEADNRQEENATLQLRDMIESMTPKKEKPTRLKGRKSLAVGSAKGLLGKRPAELDENEGDNEDGTPKRLKLLSNESSPVKKVHLPKPSKEETTGRLTRAEQRLLATVGHGSHTPSMSQSPVKNPVSPSTTGRFRDMKEKSSAQKPASFEDRLDNVVGAIDISTAHPEGDKASAEDEKISLQNFLNMTNIHFIELSTTKRRHTMAQSLPNQVNEREDISPSAGFVAATTTLPLIELYQHATRELKTYISDGRKFIRKIEAETLADQPLLFKEYVEARPDIKAIMDTQFRNGKTCARLRSKESWYAWRSQLVEGLRSGLEGIKTGMNKDQTVLEEQEKLLQQTAPELMSRKEAMQQELLTLQTKLEQMRSVDREALTEKRRQLSQADQELSQKSAILKELQDQMQDKTDALGQASELKTEMEDQIAEANRVREENRRWPSKEVSALKGRVDKIDAETGWTLTTAEDADEEPSDHGVAITMAYKRQLRLFFYPSAFQTGNDAPRRRSGRKSRSVSGPNAPISLTYAAMDENNDIAKDLSTEKRFFLQLIRSQLQALSMMSKGSVSAQLVLQTVSTGWDLAEQVSSEVRRLNTSGISRVSIQGDQKLAVQLMLMRPNRSRVDIEFVLSVLPTNDGSYSTSTLVSASPVYGSVVSLLDAAKTKKVQIALNKEVENTSIGQGSWFGAVKGFDEWLQAQMLPKAEKPKQKQVTQQPQATDEAPPPPKAELPRSPIPTTQTALPSPIKRSPLAPKIANSKVQKKALPVPTQRKLWQNESVSTGHAQVQTPAQAAAPPTSQPTAQKNQDQEKENVAPFDAFGGGKPAIPPEMQEAMMHTPVKRRVGALRRSPI